MNPKRIESFSDAELVDHRKTDPFALTAIAQGGIVDLDLGFHDRFPAKAGTKFYDNKARLQSPKATGLTGRAGCIMGTVICLQLCLSRVPPKQTVTSRTILTNNATISGIDRPSPL